MTPTQLLKPYNINAVSASTKKFNLRREAVSRLLNKRNGIVLDLAMKMSVKGFEEGYVFRKLRGTSWGGQALYANDPQKNEFSHFMNGWQYLCLPLVCVADDLVRGWKLSKIVSRGAGAVLPAIGIGIGIGIGILGLPLRTFFDARRRGGAVPALCAGRSNSHRPHRPVLGLHKWMSRQPAQQRRAASSWHPLVRWMLVERRKRAMIVLMPG
ncbi:hypothetical protein [Variovorax sp. W6]|uniref:hypothetical protein n=1 Tax=Variovorax sp. W6 TaxID=3093895 RepID=UPI003D804BFE